MTNETIPTKYEINPGEWVDVEAVFDRHTALTTTRTTAGGATNQKPRPPQTEGHTMNNLDAVRALLLGTTISGALYNTEKHEDGKDYRLDVVPAEESKLGETSLTLTMNLKSAGYVAKLFVTGRLTNAYGDTRKKRKLFRV